MMLLRKVKPQICLILAILHAISAKNQVNSNDPFGALGIPDMNPRTMLSELDKESDPKPQVPKSTQQLKTIDDLPSFLQKSNLNEDDGINILTRFLIQDDITLKKFGVVYDQSGFDGISKEENIAPIGTEDRLVQRSRSTANIWVY